jgi:hypothetical protein
LLVKYDTETLNNIKSKNANEFELLCMFVDNACYFVDMPDKKIDFVELKKINPKTGLIIENYIITEKDLVNFNPLEYNCTLQGSSSYYKVGTTGKLLIVPSDSDLRNALENKNRETKNN